MKRPASPKKRFWTRLAALTVGTACYSAVYGSSAFAQIGWAPAGEQCVTETSVSGVITEKKTCVRYRPITETVMRRQDCVTFRDECRVGYRQEQFLQCVPKVCYDPVTVDEGCYKMVWCPKPVTKMVPRTTTEQRVACRTVPYTYTQKVPQTVSRMVPECRTRYVPEQYTTYQQKPFCAKYPTQQAVAPSCSGPVPTCSGPIGNWSGIAPSMPGPMVSPGVPMPTYDPAVSMTAPMGYGQMMPGPTLAGPVPNPTPDPMSYYPTHGGMTSPTLAPEVDGLQHAPAVESQGPATWSTVPARPNSLPEGNPGGVPTGRAAQPASSNWVASFMQGKW